MQNTYVIVSKYKIETLKKNNISVNSRLNKSKKIVFVPPMHLESFRFLIVINTQCNEKRRQVYLRILKFRNHYSSRWRLRLREVKQCRSKKYTQ